MRTFFSICAAVLLFSSVAVCETANSKGGAKTVYRSRSGGSASADILVNKKKDTSKMDDSNRAMISDEAMKKESMAPKKRRIPHSRSGGSQSAKFSVIPN